MGTAAALGPASRAPMLPTWFAPRKRAEIREAIAGFADLGVDEVMLHCYGLSPDQVNRLADAL
jgi:phosphoenolpyruvate carboxylase